MPKMAGFEQKPVNTGTKMREQETNDTWRENSKKKATRLRINNEKKE
jgi:hypothetical protein